MDETTNQPDWLAQIHERELDGVFGLMLDALAPLGPLAAQLLYVAQPVAGVIGGGLWRDTAAGLAQALEEPGGVDALRARLDEMGESQGKG